MKLIYTLIITTFAMPVFAHGPTPQKTDQSITINTKPAIVWQLISEPCSIKKWHPDVADCQFSDPKNLTITLKNGHKINEEIDELDQENMTISYRLGNEVDIKALPVSSLSGRIKVSADQSNAKVSWLARYYRFDTTNEPPAGMDDEAAQNAVNTYVKSALSGLRNTISKK